MYRRTSASATRSQSPGQNPLKSEESMSPRSTPFSAYPTHSYGIPNGGSIPRITLATSLHESREPPGVARSLPNGSSSTLRYFQLAGHSHLQLLFPFLISVSPRPPPARPYGSAGRSF